MAVAQGAPRQELTFERSSEKVSKYIAGFELNLEQSPRLLCSALHWCLIEFCVAKNIGFFARLATTPSYSLSNYSVGQVFV